MSLKFRNWLPLALAITLICGLVYLAVQQDLRQGANDPQIQIAEDLREDLNKDKKLENLVKNIDPDSIGVDLNKSLAQFVIVFDEQNHPTFSDASLDGRIPTPPKGVFDYVASGHQDMFTWEPKVGVRIAAVVLKYKKGFVLAGRSLREVEKREDNLLKTVELGWAVAIFSTLIVSLIFTKLR